MRKLLLALTWFVILSRTAPAQVLVPGQFWNGIYIPPHWRWPTVYPVNNTPPNVNVFDISPRVNVPAKEDPKVTVNLTQPQRPTLSAPIQDISWRGRDSLRVVATIEGLNGTASAIVQVGPQLKTVTVGDSFTAGDTTYRVIGVSARGINVIAQQMITIR